MNRSITSKEQCVRSKPLKIRSPGRDHKNLVLVVTRNKDTNYKLNNREGR